MSHPQVYVKNTFLITTSVGTTYIDIESTVDISEHICGITIKDYE